MITPFSGFLVKPEPVTEDEIRRLFNEGRYVERVLTGQLLAVKEKEGHPTPPLGGEPECTHSQIWHYYTLRRELVAVVHQYQRPDGTIGLSGRIDPKALYMENRAVYVPAKRSH